MKPVVVVIENPQEDPDVYINGDVELIELSTYPMSKWGADEVTGYGEEYAEKIEYARARFPVGSPGWQALNWMVEEFRRRLVEAGGEEEDD